MSRFIKNKADNIIIVLIYHLIKSDDHAICSGVSVKIVWQFS